jgi:hypothetical protein
MIHNHLQRPTHTHSILSRPQRACATHKGHARVHVPHLQEEIKVTALCVCVCVFMLSLNYLSGVSH